MHACACAFCFVGSFSALLIEYVTPALLSADLNAGASNWTQRTDDFVSGSRTQTWTLALCELTPAPAPPTAATAAAQTSSSGATLKMFLLTCSLLRISVSGDCHGLIAGS